MANFCHCCGAYWACECDPQMVKLPLHHEALNAARASMKMTKEEFCKLAGIPMSLLEPSPRPVFVCRCGNKRW